MSQLSPFQIASLVLVLVMLVIVLACALVVGFFYLAGYFAEQENEFHEEAWRREQAGEPLEWPGIAWPMHESEGSGFVDTLQTQGEPKIHHLTPDELAHYRRLDIVARRQWLYGDFGTDPTPQV